MNKEKFIFLDIDGVLNPNVNIHMRKLKGESTCADSIKLPGDKLYRLKRICNDTGAKVVVSSSWRIGFKRDASIPSPSHINLYTVGCQTEESFSLHTPLCQPDMQQHPFRCNYIQSQNLANRHKSHAPCTSTSLYMSSTKVWPSVTLTEPLLSHC